MEALIHVTELSSKPFGKVEDIISKGETLTAKVIKIDPEHKKIALSLKEDSLGGALDDIVTTSSHQDDLPEEEEENEEGHTNDFREIRDRLGDGMGDIALGEGPRKVDEDRTDDQDTLLDVSTPAKSSGFYNE